MNYRPVINKKNCTGCGECARVCPKDVIRITEGKAETVSENCMLCSHCYSVCRFNAVSFEGFLKDISFFNFDYDSKIMDYGKIKPDLLVNIFRSRKSIRLYKETYIHDEVIRDLVEFASTAPSGSNLQEWEFIAINGKEKVFDLAEAIKKYFIRLNKIASNPFIRYGSIFFIGKKLLNYFREHYVSVAKAIELSNDGVDQLFHGAPSVIVVHGSADGSTPMEDACYASYNICMLAKYMGYGTCLIGYAVASINNSRKLREYLNIPEGNRVYSVITLGEPDIEYYHHSLRKEYSLEFM